MLRIGVTGTDTGVGKTAVTCALAAALVRRGIATSAMKPIETGVTRGSPGSDAVALRHATGNRDGLDDVSPITFYEPVAPRVAAERAGQPIDLGLLDAGLARLSTGRGAVLVEGAGGLLVPITREVSFADLFRRWALDVVLVSANRLGAVNHILLTLHAARGYELPVKAIVLNAADPAAPSLAQSTNAAVIRELVPLIPLITFPRVSRVASSDVLADAAESSGLLAAVAPSIAARTPSL